MSQDRLERIKKLLTQGKTRAEIADSFGISPGAVNTFMSKHKLYRCDFASEPIRFFWKPDTLKLLETMLLDKQYTIQQICEHFKIDVGQLRNAVKRYKLSKVSRRDWAKRPGLGAAGHVGMSKPDAVGKTRTKADPAAASAQPIFERIEAVGCHAVVGRIPRTIGSGYTRAPVYCCAPVIPNRVFCQQCFEKRYPDIKILLRAGHA